jgi:signal transduction histidine kinase
VKRRPFVLLIGMLVSLSLLSAVPYWTFRTAEVLRREHEYIIEPARDLITRFDLATAQQQWPKATNALAMLQAIAPRLSPPARDRLRSLGKIARNRDETATLAASLRLQHELQVTSRANHVRLLDAQRRGLAWSAALFMITLFAMLAVGWMTWRQRMLLAEVGWAQAQANRSARDEQALRAAAAAVAAPLTIEEVVRQIARSAVNVSNANAGYAAQLEIDGTMHVIAVAGDSGVQVDAKLNYTGTVIQQIVQTHAAALVEDPELSRNHKRALVAPMIEAEGPVGVLTLLYDGDLDEATIPLLLARANTFGDLAAIALRKARVLEQSEARRQQLEDIEKGRSRLLRGFSHDIRNPLANADGFLQLMQMGLQGELTAEQSKTLERARASLATGLRLLRDLLDFVLVSVGRVQLNVVATPLSKIIYEAVEDHRGMAESKNINLTFAPGEKQPTLETDVDRVRQVLDNLISNAVKYTPDGGKVEVYCELTQSDDQQRPGDWLRIDVSDNGKGIAAEHHDVVFHEFTRLDEGGEMGVGIGLAISQWVANALGGKITLTSELGAGSTFTLWLPLYQAALAPDTSRAQSSFATMDVVHSE